jgi:hypothetical protein
MNTAEKCSESLPPDDEASIWMRTLVDVMSFVRDPQEVADKIRIGMTAGIWRRLRDPRGALFEDFSSFCEAMPPFGLGCDSVKVTALLEQLYGATVVEIIAVPRSHQGRRSDLRGRAASRGGKSSRRSEERRRAIAERGARELLPLIAAKLITQNEASRFSSKNVPQEALEGFIKLVAQPALAKLEGRSDPLPRSELRALRAEVKQAVSDALDGAIRAPVKVPLLADLMKIARARHRDYARTCSLLAALPPAEVTRFLTVADHAPEEIEKLAESLALALTAQPTVDGFSDKVEALTTAAAEQQVSASDGAVGAHEPARDAHDGVDQAAVEHPSEDSSKPAEGRHEPGAAQPHQLKPEADDSSAASPAPVEGTLPTPPPLSPAALDEPIGQSDAKASEARDSSTPGIEDGLLEQCVDRPAAKLTTDEIAEVLRAEGNNARLLGKTLLAGLSEEDEDALRDSYMKQEPIAPEAAHLSGLLAQFNEMANERESKIDQTLAPFGFCTAYRFIRDVLMFIQEPDAVEDAVKFALHGLKAPRLAQELLADCEKVLSRSIPDKVRHKAQRHRSYLQECVAREDDICDDEVVVYRIDQIRDDIAFILENNCVSPREVEKTRQALATVIEDMLAERHMKPIEILATLNERGLAPDEDNPRVYITNEILKKQPARFGRAADSVFFSTRHELSRG